MHNDRYEYIVLEVLAGLALAGSGVTGKLSKHSLLLVATISSRRGQTQVNGLLMYRCALTPQCTHASGNLRAFQSSLRRESTWLDERVVCLKRIPRFLKAGNRKQAVYMHDRISSVHQNCLSSTLNTSASVLQAVGFSAKNILVSVSFC